MSKSIISNEDYRNIVENLYDGLYYVNKDRVIEYWNPAAEKITGFSAEDVVGRSCRDNILNHVDSDGKILCKNGCPLQACLNDGKPTETEVFLHHKKGHRIPISVRVTPLRNENGEIIGSVELFSDISNQYATSLRIKELEELAYLDLLTRLANQRYTEKELSDRFTEFKRYQLPFGIMLIDIDHFSQINDKFGYDVGDQVLKMVAHTFLHNARPYDLFGRWGGEEFIGIIRNVDLDTLVKIAKRYLFLISQSFILYEYKPVNVTVSIGVTSARLDDTADSILERSAKLLLQCKNNGRNQIAKG